MVELGTDLVGELRRLGLVEGGLLAVVLAPGAGAGFTAVPSEPSLAEAGQRSLSVATEEPAATVRCIEGEMHPRWVLWSNADAATLARQGVRLARSWDVAAAHRLLFGGVAAAPDRVWAALHGLAVEDLPRDAPADLFGGGSGGDGDPESPVRPDGYLRPEWATGGFRATAERARRWSETAAVASLSQQALLRELVPGGRALSTARSESAAELLCAEMSVDGLPMDRGVAEDLVASLVGARPQGDADSAASREERDAEVLRHAPAGRLVDLRSPGQVRSLLLRIGFDLPDTRAWRLQELEGAHPLIGALLRWRKAERVATTYGYAWLDEHLGADGRLRGTWSGSDGAAGRMAASSGLHNMPAEMRSAVVAEAGHAFVRADLGQIEPRVLAAVSRDPALARASLEPDMYSRVAGQLGVDRATAKVAVLGAMYGQTTGHGAQALRGLASAYPVAMAYLERAAREAGVGHDLRTYGGRLVVMSSTNANEVDEREARRQAAARGRYGRNALVQGAAAELFKAWAATVRARGAPLGARIVLCLHDELLVHVPRENADATVRLVDDCLQEAARRWAPDDSVRFVAETGVIARWSDAKD